MASIRIVKKFDLKGLHDDLIDCAEDGIEAACAETTDWIKQDVLLDQKYLDTEYFPEVKPATRATKNKRGERQVLIHTGHLKDSWNFSRSGLEGIVGSGTEGYFKKIYTKWKIDQLWLAEHSKESMEIIKKAMARCKK
jgi:hypothetical protein